MSANTFEWTLEQFPDLRLANHVVENPRSLLAAIFGTPLEDIPTTLGPVATYVTVFDAAQHCVVSIEKALIDKAIDATRKVVETEEAKQRLLELALYDAQMAVMSIAGELLHHAFCRDDEQAAELLRAWTPDRVWKFLDLSAAIQAESVTKGWTEAEFSPAAAVPATPTPQAVPKLMAVPLRTAISMPPRRATNPYREKDWFRKRTSQAWSNAIFQRLERGRRALGEDPVPGAGDAEAGENADDPDGGSDSEPEPSGVADPLDPEPDFRRHPNVWRLWTQRQARRQAERAERARTPPRESRPAASSGPAPSKTEYFYGDHKDVDRFMNELSNYFELAGITDEMKKIRTAGSRCRGNAQNWYQTYQLKIDPEPAIAKLGKFEEDPLFRTWAHFQKLFRESHGGGRPRREDAVSEWNGLRQTGGIDAFLDAITRLMWVTGYSDDIVKDKLAEGLKRELALDWAKVQQKPKSVEQQIAMLRDMGHSIERFESGERSRNGRREDRREDRRDDRRGSRRDDRQQRRPSRDGGRRGDRNRPHPRSEYSRSEKRGSKGPRSRSDRERGSKSASSSSYEKATKGVDSEIILERRRDGDCLKCGKSGHAWADCWQAEPSNKRSRDDDRDRKREGYRDGNRDRGGASASAPSKKPRIAAVAASEPGRIIEIPEDEATDPDDDLWA